MAASVALAACGGGGGGGKSTPPELIKMSKQVISVEENSSASLSFSSDLQDLAFELTDETPSGLGAVVLAGSALEITAGDTDRPGQISGVLYSQERGVSHNSAKDITVVIKNTSAQALEEQVENLLQQRGEIMGLAEDKAVMQFVLESAYLSSLITDSDKSSQINGFDAQNGRFYINLTSEISTLESVFQDYNQGSASDSQLSSTLEDTNASVANHSDYAAQKLAEISTYSDAYLGDLTQTEMTYDPISGRYSRYLGQSSMGSYSNEGWGFNADYLLLSDLITQNLSDPLLLCEAD